jgi:hypothetical protein
VLVVMLTFSAMVAGLCVLTLSSSKSTYDASRSRLDSTKAFYVSEGGMDYVLGQLLTDPYWPARSTTFFPTVDADGSFESAFTPMGSHGGEFQVKATYVVQNAVPSTWTGTGFPSGFVPFTPITFTNRATSKPAFSQIQFTVTGRYNGRMRWVKAGIRYRTTLYGGAIVSDAAPVAGTGSGKTLAINNDAIVFDTTATYVYGGIQSNDTPYVASTTTPLTNANASTKFAGWSGTVTSGLYGTSKEIPDYTAPGSATQLFDFGRFKAAAVAGAGAVYANLTAFATAVRAANTAGTPLQGIIYVNVDPAVEGGSPKLDTSTSGTGCGAAGINIQGTLVFHFINPPDNFYKVFGEAPLHINAGANDGTFNPSDPTTFKTGYPPVLPSSKDPTKVDITGAGYPNFLPGDDMPALMFDNGTVDIHQECNICGVVYTPSYMEVENKHNARQYFDGSIITGGGIYWETGSSPGVQVLNFDSNTVDSLATFDLRGQSPTIATYSAGK